MTDSQERAARIGAAVAYAETLRGQAEALQESAAQLLLGLEARAQGLGAQEQRLAAQIAALGKQVERLGPQAFAGSQAAVEKEMRAALKGAPGMIGAAAREVTIPVQLMLTASLGSIKEAEASLTKARAQFTFRALAVIGAGALGALTLTGAGGYAMIGGQRAEISAGREELARLQERARAVAATVEEMEKKGRELDAKGVRFPTDTCRDQNGKLRLCVEIDPTTGDILSPDGRRHYRIPKGF